MSDAYLKELREQEGSEVKMKVVSEPNALVFTEPDQDGSMDGGAPPPVNPSADDLIKQRTGVTSPEIQMDEPDRQVRFSEKKRLGWAGKTCVYRDFCVDLNSNIRWWGRSCAFDDCRESGMATHIIRCAPPVLTDGENSHSDGFVSNMVQISLVARVRPVGFLVLRLSV